MINPGVPVQDAREAFAARNIEEFVAEFQQHGGHLGGNPVRDPSADADGRYGWNVPLVGGRTLHLLMPGVEFRLLTNDLTPHGPRLILDGECTRWRDAVNATAPLPGREG